MIVKPYVQIAIRTEKDTANWALGDAFIQSLCAGKGILAPEHISNNIDAFAEPFVSVAESRERWMAKASVRVNGALSEWHQDFAWRRKKKLKSIGSVTHTSRNLRGQVVPGNVSLKSIYSEEVDWLDLFKTWCDVLSPQLGMLHPFVGPELLAEKRHDSFQVGSFGSLLNPYIPDIGWLMYFGKGFSAGLDVGKLRSSGFIVEDIGVGSLIRVTENFSDIYQDFSFFNDRRKLLKTLIQMDFSPR